MSVKFLLLLSSVIFYSVASQARLCETIFLVSDQEYNQKNIASFLDQVERDSQTSKIDQPEFIDRSIEQSKVPKWSGIKNVPRLIKNAISDFGSVINFPLMYSDKGVVKSANPAQFVTFRLNHNWRGKVMDTNIGVPITALIERMNRQAKYLIEPNPYIRAVLIFDHGGGTKTTGHHIAIAMANHFIKYGIVILSMDNPDHAYGSRAQFKDYEELIEYKLHFRRNFISPEVPVFYGGHSWGGQLADVMMRLSDRNDLAIQKDIAGVISLSPPLDPAPGKKLRDKWDADDRASKDPQIFDSLPPFEKDLPGQLLLAGKNNLLAWTEIERLGRNIDWSKPEHGGTKYIPTLHVMGQSDFLYLGHEKVYREYVESLSNVTVHKMGERVDFYGYVGPIGHLIFDHYVWVDSKSGKLVELPQHISEGLSAGKKMEDLVNADPSLTPVYETFYVMKSFIEKRLKELGKLDVDQNLGEISTRDRDSHYGTGLAIINKYLTNLVFQKFAKQFIFRQKVDTPKMTEIKAQMSELEEKAKSLRKIKSPSVEQKQEQTDVENEIKKNRDLIGLRFIPEGELRDFAIDSVSKRESIRTEFTSINKKIDQLKRELEALKIKDRELAKNFEKLLAEYGKTSQGESDVDLAAAMKQFDRVKELMRGYAEHSNKMTLAEAEGRVEELIDLRVRATELAKEFYIEFNRFSELRDQVEVLWLSKAREGKLTDEIKVALEKWEKSDLRVSIEKLSSELNSLEDTRRTLNAAFQRLESDYILKIVPDLYTEREIRFEDILQSESLDEMIKKHGPAMQALWMQWQSLWKDAPAPEKTSLY